SALVVQSACPLYWIRPRRASPLFPYPTLFRSLPSAAGRLMQAEVEALTRALDEPERPVAALVGGAKVSTKLELLGNLIERVDLRSEEHTSELQSRENLVCRLLLEKKKQDSHLA